MSSCQSVISIDIKMQPLARRPDSESSRPRRCVHNKFYKTVNHAILRKKWKAPRENNHNTGSRPYVNITQHPVVDGHSYSVNRNAQYRKTKDCKKV